MKNNKLKFLIVVLVFFLQLFFVKYKDTFAIYRSNLNTTINLTVLDPNASYEVTFNMNDGNDTVFETRYVQYNGEVGSLNTPTRTNYNFLGWYDGTGNNANRIYSDEIITGQVTYYAKWQKIICKKVTDNNKLHTETCVGSQGCTTTGTGFDKTNNNIITYGTTYGVNSPIAGDAYDCDVNNDGTYDPQDQYGKYTERFYFLKEYEHNDSEKTATLIYYTSFDSNGRIDSQHNNNIGSTNYNAALNWLPNLNSWTNPGLIGFDSNNGNITRFVTLDEIETVCGPISRPFPAPQATIAGTNYWNTCQKWFLFENSRFQSSSLGRAGIWIEMYDNQHYRIQTSSVAVMSVASSSENTARPVIEIPFSAFEGYKNTDKHTIIFNTHGGTPEIETRRVYTGDTIGAIATVTKEHFTFDGWYANYSNGVYSVPVDAETLVDADMTLHAKWNPIPTSTVTFDANGGTINGESTYDLVIDSGNTIDENDIPEAAYFGHTFDGWYYDDELTDPFDIEDEITDDITLYAKWIEGNPVARVNGVGYDTLEEAIAAVPTGKVKTTVTILQNITLSNTVTIPNTKYVELDVGNYTISCNIDSENTSLITNQGKLDIISGTISLSSVSKEKSSLISNASGATLNISGGTISSSNMSKANTLVTNSGTLNVTGGTLANNCYVPGATTEFLAITNSGTTTISGGSITSYGQSATINQNGGTLNVSDGEIIAHSVTKGQAIYIAGGTTNISGDAYLENMSGTGDSRACVDNNGGTLNITGGTIVSKGYSAVIAKKNGTTTQIGTDNGIIDITTPVLRGQRYGLEKASAATTATIKVYDGIFESVDQEQAISTTSVTKPDGVDFNTSGTVIIDGVTYHTAHLIPPQITINFYEETNGTAIPVTVDTGSTIGNLLPTPNPKQGYYFAGWFIDGNLLPVTSDTTVTGPFNAYAKWVQSVSDATFNRTMNIQLNNTVTIAFEEDDIEDVEYSSSDTSVATVDADGTVHAVGLGEATITLTGSLSGDSETVTVTVTQIMYTVSFYDDDYDPNDLENSTLFNTVQVASGSSVAAGSMPTPTNTNYVLSDWYINGDSSTPFTSEVTVTGDMVVVANWKEKVTYATLTKPSDPFELIVGNNGQITLSETIQNDIIENFTVTSSDDTVATVSKNGNVITVTGAGVGDTTITITGSLSNVSVTVPVSVDVLKYTVTFRDGNTPIDSVQVESGGTVGEEMPNNPTKTNYIFNGWVYDYQSNLTPFTSATEITGDIDVLASWKEQINIATLPDDPITISLGADKQIIVTATGAGNLVEDYTLSSSNTNYVQVNGKTITGASLGSVTLTIEGVTSHRTRTITVNVVNSHSVTFDPDNGDTPTVIQVEVGSSIDASNETLPSNPTKTDLLFDDWYLYDEANNALTTTRLDTMATVTSDITYKAKWVSTTYVAAIGANNYYTTLSSAISAVSSSSSAEIRILQDIVNPSGRTTVNGSKNITIDANGHTLSCDNNGSTASNLLYVDGGTLTVKNGTFTCSKTGLATFETSANTNPKSILNIESSAIVTNTGNRGAVYNCGTVNVNGGTLESSTSVRSTIVNGNASAVVNMSGGSVTQTATTYTSDSKGNGKGAIKVDKGTVVITGGTVISMSTNSAAIDHTSSGTLTIGTDDTDNNYDATTPVIQGDQYGVYSTKAYSVFDGIIKGKTGPYAVNNPDNITATEANTEIVHGMDGDYYTLYYTGSGATPTPTATPTPAPSTYTIVLDGHGGTFSGNNTTSKEFSLGATITATDLLPEPTKGIYTFDGWYEDSNASETPVTFPYTIPSTAGTTTFYAKWTYVASNEIVDVNTMSDALKTYFNNINTWKNGTESELTTNLSSTFSANSCSACNGDNSCTARGAGTWCEQPKGYDTGVDGAINVYLSDAVNKQKGAAATYITTVNDVMYNLIPGEVYYWELASDPSVHGLVKATETRRTIYSTVGNVRDLGGLSVSYTENGHTVTGTIDYGRLYRGARITNANDTASLTKLGITREIDLRSTTEAGSVPRLSKYDYTDPNAINGFQDIVVTNYIINPEAVNNYSYIDNSGNPQTVVPAHTSEYTAMKEAMKKVMNYIINDDDNIYFHCTIGTDRTGTMAYLLEGLLGVSEEDRVEDYEMTYFYGLSNRTRYHDHYGTTVNPRFKFLHLTYPSNQAIYEWFTYGDSAAEKEADDALIAAFRHAIIH